MIINMFNGGMIHYIKSIGFDKTSTFFIIPCLRLYYDVDHLISYLVLDFSFLYFHTQLIRRNSKFI